MTPSCSLVKAASDGNTLRIKYLLRTGIHCTVSAIDVSIHNKHWGIYYILMDWTRNNLINIPLFHGIETLYQVLECKKHDILVDLLSLGYSPMFDKMNKTPILHTAIKTGKLWILDLLISHGASIKTDNIMEICLEREEYVMMDYLLEAGASVKIDYAMGLFLDREEYVRMDRMLRSGIHVSPRSPLVTKLCRTQNIIGLKTVIPYLQYKDPNLLKMCLFGCGKLLFDSSVTLLSNGFNLEDTLNLVPYDVWTREIKYIEIVRMESCWIRRRNALLVRNKSHTPGILVDVNVKLFRTIVSYL